MKKILFVLTLVSAFPVTAMQKAVDHLNTKQSVRDWSAEAIMIGALSVLYEGVKEIMGDCIPAKYVCCGVLTAGCVCKHYKGNCPPDCLRKKYRKENPSN